jgi:hypothetical protein
MEEIALQSVLRKKWSVINTDLCRYEAAGGGQLALQKIWLYAVVRIAAIGRAMKSEAVLSC